MSTDKHNETPPGTGKQQKPETQSEPVAGKNNSVEKGPLADKTPAVSEEPLADKTPSAGDEPSANKEPSAGDEPSADKKPSASQKPSANRRPTDKSSQAQASKRGAVDKPGEGLNSQTKQKHTERASGSATKPRFGLARLFRWAFAIVVLFALIALTALAYWFWQQHLRDKDSAAKEQQTLQQNLSQTLQGFEQSLQNQQQQLQQSQQTMQQQNQQLQAEVEELKQRQLSQKKRLLAMSTTSREDWLLAEAEYLLRLANQRVLIERQATNAIALLQEADAILKEFADPDLFDVRAAIRDDMVALRLAEKIDSEGLYLELRALGKQVEKLSLIPQSFDYELEAKSQEQEVAQIKNSFSRFISGLGDYVRIIKHDEKPAALMPPEQSQYLQLNLRMLLEQAQLAVLREQPKVYKSSLTEADIWLERYFPITTQREQYREQLQRLADREVLQTLPDISNSLKLLNTYIAELHSLAELEKTSAANQLKQRQNNSNKTQAPTSAPIPEHPIEENRL
ncbi:uroporphyrinogen-III C-methyltransferase [Agaribacterium haliotis]|uniref:uroporphyrinogen-III C-methyltransferase n=1 Tax=Agaribacterium haliotis TaxID=2013869 RepID=UPI000BB58551|nr:uroporphyrinogen-III C-methyltransferase [Agaribacterium haliotis]